MTTYPGTDLVKRLCYGCQQPFDTLEQLEEAWVDSDEDAVVCTPCKKRAEQDYPQSHFTRVKEFGTTELPGGSVRGVAYTGCGECGARVGVPHKETCSRKNP